MAKLDVSKFITNAGQSVTARLTGDLTAKLTDPSSVFSTGAAGTVARILGESGALSGVSNALTSLTGDVDSFISSSAAKLFGGSSKSPINDDVGAIAGSRAGTFGAGKRYPLDLDKYYTGLQFMDYHRPAPLAPPKIVNSSSIFLPLPTTLTDHFSVDYNTESLGLIGGVVDSLQATDTGAAGSGTAGGAAARAAPSLLKLAGLTTAANLAGESADVVGQLAGAAINSNVGVVFKGPQLRTFQMTWDFAPHNPKESAAITDIINTIKQNMLPSMTFEKSTGILSYPKIVQVSVKPGVIKYKRAFISDVQFNYAANGIPTFFADDNATFIQLTLSFMEIEYFLSEDFGGKSGQGLNNDAKDIGSKLANTDFGTVGNTLRDQATSGINSLFSNPQGG